MTTRREFLKLAAAFVCAWTIVTQPACADEVLYVGDAGDNTIKVFDANNGMLLDVSDPPAVTGLMGPRGMILRGDDLLVVNQNVGLTVAGEVLRFDAGDLTFLGAVIPASDPDAPYAPFGIILGGPDTLLIGNLMRKNSASPGHVAAYDADFGTLLGELTVKGNEHHPRGVVFGPDGALYTAARDLKNGRGGTIFRFSKGNGKAEVFIDDEGGFGRLNRPDGLVFGPDGLLYVTSFSAGPTDPDSIRVYDADGELVDAIELWDPATEPRAFSQAILFGPGGALFVSILDKKGINNNLGELRRYNVLIHSYDVFVPNGVVFQPYYMTFGNTDPATLEYLE